MTRDKFRQRIEEILDQELYTLAEMDDEVHGKEDALREIMKLFDFGYAYNFRSDV